MRTPSGTFFFLTLFFLAVTKAEIICSSSSQKSALVVMDMQPGFIHRGENEKRAANVPKLKQIIEEQIAVINQAKEAGIPIIFIEYAEEKGEYGDTYSELKAAVASYKDVKVFKKTSDGVFESDNHYKKNLVEYLAKNQIGTLIMTGANGGACVASSIHGALDGGCSIVAYNKGIADFNFKYFIYPYVGRFDNLKPKCQNCSFNEVSSREDLSQYMISIPDNSPRPAKKAGAVE